MPTAVLATMCAFSPQLQAADLSMLSDFGRPDIPQQRLGMSPLSNAVGVEQSGLNHWLYVEQVSGDQNNAQVWQAGVDQQAKVAQQGSGNELRLLQSDGGGLIDLQQIGAGNQMAISQVGIDNTVQGRQVGTDNELVLMQYGTSQFTFTQQGDRNQIVADMPQGLSVHVDQIGNEMRFELQPAP
jgi:hypothetical protein